MYSEGGDDKLEKTIESMKQERIRDVEAQKLEFKKREESINSKYENILE